MCIVLLRQVREEARGHLEREHLDRPGEEHCGLLLDIAMEAGQVYPERDALPFEVLMERVSQYFYSECCALSREAGARLLRTVHDCNPGDGTMPGLLWRAYKETAKEDVTVEQGLVILRALLRERALFDRFRQVVTY